MADQPHANAPKAETAATKYGGSELSGSIAGAGNPSQNLEEHYKDLCQRLTKQLEKMNRKHAFLKEENESLRPYIGLYHAAFNTIEKMNANFAVLPNSRYCIDCKAAIDGYRITELRTLSDHVVRPVLQPIQEQEYNQVDMAPNKLQHQGHLSRVTAFSRAEGGSKRLSDGRLADKMSLKSHIQLHVAHESQKENVAKIKAVNTSSESTGQIMKHKILSPSCSVPEAIKTSSALQKVIPPIQAICKDVHETEEEVSVKNNSLLCHETSQPANDQGTTHSHANKRVSMPTLLAQADAKKCKIAKDDASTKGISEVGLVDEDRWMSRYNDLVAYKNQHGDCCVPQTFKPNPSLGWWVMSQRAFFKRGDLSQDRIAKLNELGFVWFARKRVDWMTRYN